jgi:hypothetical protein
VSVFNNDGSQLETVFGPYPVTLTLSSGTLFGRLSTSTVAGVARFTGLRILSSGSFAVTATSPGLGLVRSGMVTVTNRPFVLAFNSAGISTSVNFLVQLALSITGEDTAPYLGLAEVTLTEQNNKTFSGSSDLFTNTGTALVAVYFNQSGMMTLVAQCGELITEVPVMVNQLRVKVQEIKPVVRTI